MQRIEGRGLLCHRPEELNVQDAPNESTDAAGRKEDHLIRKKGSLSLEKAKLTQYSTISPPTSPTLSFIQVPSNCYYITVKSLGRKGVERMKAMSKG